MKIICPCCNYEIIIGEGEIFYNLASLNFSEEIQEALNKKGIEFGVFEEEKSFNPS